MAQGDTTITVIGNLVADPELRFSPTGTAVANFRVASTPRHYDRQTGGYVDAEPLFLTCTIWRQAAENVTNTLTKGDRVIVTGRLRQRSYETREGEKRTVYELAADEVGPSLRYATAQVAKTPRDGGGTGGQGGFQGRNTGDPANSTHAPQTGNSSGLPAPDDDPWSAPQGQQNQLDDEPPF